MLKLLSEFVDSQNIDVVGPHDIVNWLEGKIELCARWTERRGVMMLHPRINPRHIPIGKCQFRDKCAEIVSFYNPKLSIGLMDQDIKDRFISHGKLWLVLRGGKVVEESTVRVVTLKCKGCGKITLEKRNEILWARQGSYCLSCYPHRTSKYALSTIVTFINTGGHKATYDPILGTLVRTP